MIEALAALAVVAASLAAIGAVMAANIRGTRNVDQHLGLVQAMRAIETDLQARTNLAPGSRSGNREGIAWSIDVAPYPAGRIKARKPPRWFPHTIVARVQSPSGEILQVDSIRLLRNAAP